MKTKPKKHLQSKRLTIQHGITGHDVRELRHRLRMTQAEFATLVGNRPLAVWQWERGKVPLRMSPTIRLLERLIEENKGKELAPVDRAGNIKIHKRGRPPKNQDHHTASGDQNGQGKD